MDRPFYEAAVRKTDDVFPERVSDRQGDRNVPRYSAQSLLEHVQLLRSRQKQQRWCK